jgi:hypothetical protein
MTRPTDLVQGTLIGSPVVYLTIGTTSARVVNAGDTVRSLPQSDLERASSEFAIASRQFPQIINNVKVLNQQLHGVDNTLGAFSIEHGGVQLARAQRQATQLGARLSSSNGTVGLASRARQSLTERARRAMSRADSIRVLIASPTGSYGRLRRDTTLLREVADIRNELDIVRARMASPEGTIGRLRADSSLVDAVATTQREMTLIMTDIKRRPLRYIHF